MLKNLTVVIPAYNECGSIAAVVKEAREALDKKARYEILVVDDGSTDGTGEIARTAGARVISLKKNSGYGAALKRGIGSAKYDTICTLDADGSYSPSEIPKLLYHASQKRMVIGARKGEYIKRQVLRNFLKFFLRKLAEFLTSSKIDDVNSGMRVFDRRVLMRYSNLLCDGFSFSTSSTMIYLCAGLPEIGRAHV